MSNVLNAFTTLQQPHFYTNFLYVFDVIIILCDVLSCKKILLIKVYNFDFLREITSKIYIPIPSYKYHKKMLVMIELLVYGMVVQRWFSFSRKMTETFSFFNDACPLVSQSSQKFDCCYFYWFVMTVLVQGTNESTYNLHIISCLKCQL